MKPKIRYVIASREMGIAEVQFQVIQYLFNLIYYLSLFYRSQRQESELP